MQTNNKPNKLLILKIIISSLIIAAFYVIFYKENFDAALMDSINKISFSNESIFWYILIIVGAVLFVYNIWDGFVTKKGHTYPKILEEGRVGKDFASLNNDEKLKTIKKSKKLSVFGLIFVVVFFFLLEYFLKLYLDF